MPVRGRGHYKKSIKVCWTDRDGKRHMKAFHWRGPAHDEAKRLRESGDGKDAYVVPDFHKSRGLENL